ncbi:FadR/GntR family transcriptional regulator [Pengzhenrongella sp.]|jgi:GntR family transcriptional repressor for pyruvate dehydrogenase complex|uniref:FadR/GntR family transcriptional regulator n=1 Tax=Pengzhenrongella sp. TaxID=2888820 RepID=UPI002F93FE7E
MNGLTSGLPDEVAAAPVPAPRADGWQPVSRMRTYELVLDRIEGQIVSGALRAGQRLPPERELASMLGVSRPAVREALRILEAQGAVRSQVGTGPDSGTTIDRLPSDALARLLRLHVALGSFPIDDVVDTRVALERASVVLACRNAQPADLARMRAELVAMDVPELDRETFNQHDTNFHVAIADAGGNRLMSDVTRAIRESVRMPILAGWSAMPESGPDSWPSVRDGVRADHHAVFLAIEAGRAELAADRLESHIRRYAIYLPIHD